MSTTEAIKRANKNYYEKNKERKKEQSALYQKTLKKIYVSPALHIILKNMSISNGITIPNVIENLLKNKIDFT